MARIRSIKPEFWSSEQVMECSTTARLFFIGLWNFCDDGGNHALSLKTLKAEIFPGDDITSESVRGMLDELSSNGLIVFYTSENKDLLHITGWHHQRIDKPTYKHPPYVEEKSKPTRRTLDESSTPERRGEEGRGEEGRGEEGSIGASMELDGGPPSKKSEAIPAQAIVDCYNRTMTNLPKVRELTSKRRSAIRRAWQQSSHRQSLNFWRAYFEECADDGFLSGVGPYGAGHENWRPNFDYLIRPEVVTRVFEAAMHRMGAPA